MTVQVLYCEPKGVYSTLDVPMWTAERDARLYAGPDPIVAHPPCNRWAYTLAPLCARRYGYRIGDDGGCFVAAMLSLRKFGGVLEHPAHSIAFEVFGLGRPKRGSWQERERGVYVTEVSQVAYGHRARKRTWLCYVGKRPPFDLDWSEPPHTARVSQDLSSMRGEKTSRSMSKAEAIATPLPFALTLLQLARECGGPC